MFRAWYMPHIFPSFNPENTLYKPNLGKSRSSCNLLLLDIHAREEPMLDMNIHKTI